MFVWHKELGRAQLLGFMRTMAPCLIGMEACEGAHYCASLTALGHEVRLVSPALVTPYPKGNKTDRSDAGRSWKRSADHP
jgi:transposase